MIKKDSQYQLEKILNWAAYLEYLQVVLQEFDPTVSLNKEIMIWYFQEGLKPSIQVQLDAQSRELDFWEEIIEKAVNVEVETLL